MHWNVIGLLFAWFPVYRQFRCGLLIMSVVHYPMCTHRTHIIIAIIIKTFWGHFIWFQVCLSQRTWDLKFFGTAHVTPLLWRWRRKQSESSARIPRDTSCLSKMSTESTLFPLLCSSFAPWMSGASYETMWGDGPERVIWLVGSWFAPCVLFSYEAESITATTTASPNWLWRKPWCSTKPSNAPHSWPESPTL